VLVTDIGEIVKETNSIPYEVFRYDSISGGYFIFDLEQSSPYWVLKPDLSSQPVYRFVDTTSRIDLVSYKASFVNNPSSEPIEYTLQVYESDDVIESATPFWIPNEISGQTEYLFIQRCKRFIQVEVEFFTELEEQYFVGSTPTIDFVLLIEVQIAESTPENTTFSTRDILQKFPSWTKIYEDSIEGSTPRFDVPQSMGGKLINASVGDHLEKVEDIIDYFNLNKSISGADTAALAWIYATNAVPSIINSVKGDDVELSMIVNYSDFINHRVDDYVFYFNPIDKVVLTLKKFTRLTVNNLEYFQNEVLLFNIFDEFGMRVGLPRLRLESNERYKQRILDVHQNPPGGNIESFKKTIRRELDLWKAVGATPSSNYIGATPNVLEMEDLEYLNKYFDDNGNPTESFITFVENLNELYPSNWGYVSWGNMLWDYAGKRGEGVSRVPFVYDKYLVEATPEYYQPGVGDLSDVKLSIRSQNDYKSDADVLSENSTDQILRKSFRYKVSGIEKTSTTQISPPINVDFDYYHEYKALVSNSPEATINYVIEMEVDNQLYYANLTEKITNPILTRQENSTPYFGIKNIFNEIDNKTDPSIRFRSKINDIIYQDYTRTPATHRISSQNISNGYVYYAHYSSPNYIIENNDENNASWLVVDGYGPVYSLATPNGSYEVGPLVHSVATPRYDNFAIKYGSDMYSYTEGTYYTDRLRKTISIRPYSSTATSATPFYRIAFSELNNFVALSSSAATPQHLHLDNIKPTEYYIDPDYATPVNTSYEGYGGYSFNPEFGKTFFVPNISIRSDIDGEEFFATPKYDIRDGIATPSYIELFWNPSNTAHPSDSYYSYLEEVVRNYPFTVGNWEYFEKLSATPSIFDISEKGVIRDSEEIIYNGLLSDIVETKNVHRYNFDFDLDNPSNYIINYIEVVPEVEDENLSIWVDKNSVNPYYSISMDDDLMIPSVKTLSSEYYAEKSEVTELDHYIEGVTVRAKLNNRTNKNLESAVHTGWYYLDGEEVYVYAQPITEIFTASTPNSEYVFNTVARQGAPVIVKSITNPNIEFVQTSFTTPLNRSTPSIENSERIEARNSNNLYLGYKNVYDVSVFDPITNSYVVQNAESETEKISVSQDATPVILVKGREYIVTYKVRNSYTIDNEYLNENNSLRTRISIPATPMYGATPLSGPHEYEVTYESSIFDMSTPTGIYHSPLVSLHNEGFVYISNDEYRYNRFIAQMSPAYLYDNYNKEYSVLTIESLDENSNPKPYQKYRITSQYASATPDYVITDQDGFGYSEIRYSGAVPATQDSSLLIIQGVQEGYSDANDSATINYDIIKDPVTQDNIYAEVSNPIVRADGQSLIYINGKITSSSNAVSNIKVYYRKARMLNQLLDSTYDNYVETDINGLFRVGPITSQSASTPGYWIMSLESEMSQTTTTTPNTIVGDMVYWFEDAEDIVINAEQRIPPIQELFNIENYSTYYSTPVYKVSYLTGNPVTPSATPNVDLPAWFNIPRYRQYQMGILGSGYYDYKNANNIYPS
jgi:hypothetical protein